MQQVANKRYQVFISSTFTDLQREREEVIRSILELDHIPAGMEMFPASNESQFELIKRVIDDCDYYVVIIGGRYGSVSEEGVSYTEMEYEYAVEKGIPVLGFVHRKPEDIPSGKSDLENEARQKLANFKTKVSSGRLVKFYESPEELGGVVARSLVQAVKNTPRTGWVRADGSISIETLQEVSRLQEELSKLRAQLRDEPKPPPGSENLQQGTDLYEIQWSILEIMTFGLDDDEHHGKLSTSWNDIFSVLGPLMLDESSETRLEQQLKNYVLEEIINELKKPKLNVRNLTLGSQDFQTIKVQLLSLGYIKKSDKKHTAGDRSTYWSLSVLGEQILMSLRAIKK